MTRLTRTLLCTALLLCAAPFAPADIVHVPLNVTYAAGYTYNDSSMSWSGGYNSYNLDINGDGINELTFWDSAQVMTGIKAGYSSGVNPVTAAAVGATPHTSSSYWTTPLLLNDVIGPSTTFAPAHTSAVLYSDNWYDGQVGDPGWAVPGDKYLAFQFNIAGQPHYGWIRMPGTAVLTDAAYETQPNTPIHAGEVPEPACTALTAGVAALLLTHRRRRHPMAQD